MDLYRLDRTTIVLLFLLKIGDCESPGQPYLGSWMARGTLCRCAEGPCVLFRVLRRGVGRFDATGSCVDKRTWTWRDVHPPFSTVVECTLENIRPLMGQTWCCRQWFFGIKRPLKQWLVESWGVGQYASPITRCGRASF